MPPKDDTSARGVRATLPSRFSRAENPVKHFNRIQIGIAAVAIAYLVAPFVAAGGGGAAAQISPSDALQKLQVGNARYVCGKSDHPNQGADRRHETFTGGQHPFAAVLTCSDSRVPVELIFDQGFGDIFAIRVAGNITDRHQTGSIEYAVDHLGVPLVVVMGHRACGAVAASCGGGEAHDNIASIIRTIQPAVERVQKRQPDLKGDALVAEAIKENVYETITTLLSTSHTLNEAAKAGKIRVVGAVYDIEQATVSWLGPHPQESAILARGVQPNADHAAVSRQETPPAGRTSTAIHSNDAHAPASPEQPTAVAGETATRDKKSPPPPVGGKSKSDKPSPAHKSGGGHP